MKLNKMHTHPSTIVENTISCFFAVVILFFVSLFKEMSNDQNIWNFIKEFISLQSIIFLLLVIIIFITVIAFISYLIWRKTYIYIDDNFNFQSGGIFKKHIKINLDDIATIIVKKNILERILHTSKIKLELNAGGDDTIKRKLVFKDEDVEKIKSLVFKKEIKEEKLESLVTYTSKDIIMHLLLSANLASVMLGFLIFIPVFLFTIQSSKSGAFVFAIILIFALGSIIWSFIKKYFDYHNFNLWEEDGKIKVSYGLFVNYQYEIPKNKINAVIVSQTLQARLFNKVVLKVVNAGAINEEGEQSILCLYSDKKTVGKLMEHLLSDYIQNDKIIKQDEKALVTYLINKVPLIFIMAIICMFVSKWFLLIDLLFIIWAFVQYETKKIQVGNQLITVTNGFFEKTHAIIKYEKITKMNFTDTIIGKLYNIKYLKINIVGALQTMEFYAGYYNPRIANKIVKNFK